MHVFMNYFRKATNCRESEGGGSWGRMMETGLCVCMRAPFLLSRARSFAGLAYCMRGLGFTPQAHCPAIAGGREGHPRVHS